MEPLGVPGPHFENHCGTGMDTLLHLSIYINIYIQYNPVVLKVGSGDPQGSLRESQGVPSLIMDIRIQMDPYLFCNSESVQMEPNGPFGSICALIIVKLTLILLVDKLAFQN